MLYFQSFEEVFSALKRRIGLIILITLIGCIISVFIALTRIPVYNAIAVVQIEDAQVSSPSSIPGGGPDPRGGLDARRTVNLIEQRVMSRDSLLAIMDKYDLFTQFPNITLAQRLDMMRRSVSISPILSGEAWQPNQSVSGMVIDVNLDDPQKAADVANDLLARVMEEARTRSVERAQVELEFFELEEAQIREDILNAEAAIAEFKSANAEVLPSNVSILQGELTTLNGSLLTLRQEILSLESNSARVRPEALERQVSLIEDQIALVENRIAELNALLTRAPTVERELASLERELTQLNEQFTVISRRKADAEMSQSLEEQRQLARFEVLEPAIAPVYPVSRSKRSIAMLGGIASGILAVGIAFLLEMLNPPIRNAAQMERVLGIRPVISVPVLGAGATVHRKKKKKPSKFGWGVLLALLLGLVGLMVRPIAEWLGYTLTPRSAQ